MGIKLYHTIVYRGYAVKKMKRTILILLALLTGWADDVVAVCLYGAGIAAMHAVALEQHRVGFGIAEIVDGDHFDVRTALLQDGPENQTPDPPEAIDRYLHATLLNV